MKTVFLLVRLNLGINQFGLRVDEECVVAEALGVGHSLVVAETLVGHVAGVVTLKANYVTVEAA